MVESWRTFSEERADGKALMEVAAPDLYRVNSFRVLALPVEVSQGDLAKRQKEMKLREKLRNTAEQPERGALALSPPPDAEAIRRATQRMQDPECRIIDELFWFWSENPNGTEDEGLRRLRSGDTNGAKVWWSERQQSSNTRSIATHNLAVLNHALALDVEVNVPTNKLGALVCQWRDTYWQQALECWRRVIDGDEVWDRLVARIRDLDDPRVTTGMARRLRQALPSALLTISIRMAVRAAEKGDGEEAKRHLVYIRESGFDLELAGRITEDELTPMVARIKQSCDDVRAKAEADPIHADQTAQQLLSDTKLLLDGIRSVLSEQHHLRESASDNIAQAVRACMIDYGNKTENWSRCLELLDEARKLAVTVTTRNRLDEDIKQVEKIEAQVREDARLTRLAKEVVEDKVYEVSIQGSRAAFARVCTCCLGEPDGEKSISYSWQEMRGLTRYNRTISFALPICSKCREHQEEYSQKSWLLALLAAGVSTAIAFIVASLITRAEWLPFVLVGAVVTGLLVVAFSRFILLHVLSEEHACRDVAVEMTSASDQHVTFCFHNPLYAEAFAKANAAQVTVQSRTKPPRGINLLQGGSVAFVVGASLVLGLIGHSIVVGVMQDTWKQRSSARPSSTPYVSPNRPGSSPQPRPQPAPTTPRPSVSYSGLEQKINASKARVRALESEITTMDSELESLAARLRAFKREIDNYEDRVRLRLSVNEPAYQRAIDNHNALVKEHNSLVAERNRKHAEYEAELASGNDMVRRYNQGER